MEVRRRQPIGVELVRRGIITETDVEKALEIQRNDPNKKLGDILYQLNVCNPNVLIQAVGEILGQKGIILKSSDIKIKPTDYIAIDLMKNSKAIPFEIESGKIKVCFADATTNRNIESIRILLLNKGLIMENYITFESEIDKFLLSFEGTKSENLDITGQGNSITELIDNIIKTGISKRASDIHIEPLQEVVRV